MTTPNHHEPIAPENQENPVVGEWVTTTDDGSVQCVVRLGRPVPPKTTT